MQLQECVLKIHVKKMLLCHHIFIAFAFLFEVLCNLIDFGMDPQTALDVPRFCVGTGHRSALGSVSIEQGISENVIEELEHLGHQINGPVCGYDRGLFGKGQIILQSKDKAGQSVLWAGSDPRGDGSAIGY